MPSGRVSFVVPQEADVELSIRYGDLEVVGAWGDQDFHSSEVLEDRVTRMLAAFAIAYQATYAVESDEPRSGGTDDE